MFRKIIFIKQLCSKKNKPMAVRTNTDELKQKQAFRRQLLEFPVLSNHIWN